MLTFDFKVNIPKFMVKKMRPNNEAQSGKRLFAPGNLKAPLRLFEKVPTLVNQLTDLILRQNRRMGCASSIAEAAFAPPRDPPISLAEAATRQRRASLNHADSQHQPSSPLLADKGAHWRERWRERAATSTDLSSGSLKGSSRSFETADNRKGSLRAGNDREGSPLSGVQASALADNSGRSFKFPDTQSFDTPDTHRYSSRRASLK